MSDDTYNPPLPRATLPPFETDENAPEHEAVNLVRLLNGNYQLQTRDGGALTDPLCVDFEKYAGFTLAPGYAQRVRIHIEPRGPITQDQYEREEAARAERAREARQAERARDARQAERTTSAIDTGRAALWDQMRSTHDGYAHLNTSLQRLRSRMDAVETALSAMMQEANNEQ